MKLRFHALLLAIVLLVAGCGGGGGGGGGSGGGGGGGNDPAPSTPPASTPVTTGIVTFAGSRGDYSVVLAGGNYTVTDRRDSTVIHLDGASTNALRFSDITVNLTIGPKATALGAPARNQLIELYMAMLSRVPSADSLSYWIDQRNAGTMEQVANNLYAEAIRNPELTGYSAALTKTSDFVTAVYKYAFGRSGATAPTAGQVATWSARIDTHGISRGALVLEMLASARSGSGDLAAPAVVQLLNNKIAVGEYFGAQQGLNYNSADEALVRTTAIASAITSTDTVTAKALIGFTDANFNLLQ